MIIIKLLFLIKEYLLAKRLNIPLHKFVLVHWMEIFIQKNECIKTVMMFYNLNEKK